MSDWTDFCESSDIDLSDSNGFDNWLDNVNKPKVNQIGDLEKRSAEKILIDSTSEEIAVLSSIQEQDLIELKYGIVTKYNDRGFGFIKPLSLTSTYCDEIFFHISNVKKTGVEPKLIQLKKGNTEHINLWFTTEETKKGTALKDCWLSPTDIPNKNLVSFVKNVGSYLYQTLIAAGEKLESNSTVFNQSIIQSKNSSINKPELKYKVSSSQLVQIEKYIEIYNSNSFQEHYEVNNYITKNKLWDHFSEIRSLNDHGSHKRIPGIHPKFYSVVCKMLDITGAKGAYLMKATRY